jgi:hypothetical protein
MAMKFLTFHDQLVADFAAHEEYDNFALIDIVQGTQVPRTQLEVGEKIWTQALDSLCWLRGLVLQPGLDSRFQDSLLAGR